ncbi:hypothetical protein MTR67_048871 [Solanum verrucosum]|uniref:Retrotransposon gag domain-containing protein n=1 Tax=Solanum verrucosum TaxID=315347 RepID=A0AAF0ZXT9_SOLVR|nr:hypothetical protein MTR67_048871 [Solanum verrucosum]
MHGTLRDRKKDEFMDLEKGSLRVDAYEAKFHAMFCYPTQLVTTEEERTWLFVKSLNSELQVLSVHMTFASKSFNEVTDFVKKVEGVRQDVKAKALAKKSKNVDNYNGLYSKELGQQVYSAQPIQSAIPVNTGCEQACCPSANRTSLDRDCFHYGDFGQFNKE